MSSGWWLALGAVFASIVLAGVLAAAEVVITRTNPVRAYGFREEGRHGAAALVRIAEQPARYLNVVLLLTLLLHLGGMAIATAIAVEALGTIGEVVSALAMTVLLFVFAEVLPKTFAVLHTDRVALRLAPVIAALGRALGPIARGLIAFANWILPGKGLREGPFVTEAEIRAMADTASAQKAIQEGEKQLIHSIFDFGDTVVREVMIPAPDMVLLDARAPVREALEFILQHGYSRIPVHRGDRADIVGVVYAKDVLRNLHAGDVDRPLGDIAHAPTFVPESKRVAELLREMQAKKVHMALVVDEYGSVAGLVTLEDLLEELVGDIADEYDLDEPNLEPLGGERYRVNARMSVDELSQLLGLELPSGDWDTVGGLLLGLLGRVPSPGEHVEVGTVTIFADRVHGRRIQTVILEHRAPPQELQA